MPKIIKVDSGVVTIAMNNGDIITVRDYSLSFKPEINDVVEVYENGGEYIINKSQNTYNTTNIYTGKKPVNKIAYGLLGILLGCIGAHKFYAGKIGVGIVFLLFSWTAIPAIIGLIEGIIAFTKPEVEPGIILI